MPIYKIRGIDVDFPFEAYDCQIVYMEKVIQSLQDKCNALLESPTGTGKTLCLLCATLAWRKSLGDFSTGPKSQPWGFKQTEEAQALSQSRRPKLPTIVYTSRTHSQLHQVIQELKRTNYRPKMTVLGSREQLCIHDEVRMLQGKAQINACHFVCKRHKCSRQRAVSGYAKNNPNLGDDPVDIEDLVNIGRQAGPCPYYVSRELHKVVDILFAPYNYLIDRRNQKSLSVDFQNCVLIFDEAHNLESLCADAASFDLPCGLLTACISEAKKCVDLSVAKRSTEKTNEKSFNPDSFAILKALLLKLENRITEIPIDSKELGFTRPGPYIYQLLADLNITHETASMLIETIESATLLLEEAENSIESGAQQTKGTICRLESIGDILGIIFKGGDEAHAQSYRVHVQESEVNAFGAVKGKKATRTLSWWCFNPGIAMKELSKRGVGSIILTSGTLSPLDSFAQELKLEFPVQLENPHVISSNQIWAGVVPAGPSACSFNSSYRNRDSLEYKQELGNAIANFARIVPSGLLVFFPSYYLLDQCIGCWKDMSHTSSTASSTIWERICKYKQPVVEPRQSSLFPSSIQDFMTKLNDTSTSGAVFFAVCRGKVSEGLDFADHAGRAVVVIGMPFAMRNDPKIRLKREYLDLQVQSQIKEQKVLTGEEWYSQQESRAVNQAVGRVIRHRNDYGAIIFCDERFAHSNRQSQMSRWLRPHIKCYSRFGEVVFTLTRFFRDIGISGPTKPTLTESIMGQPCFSCSGILVAIVPEETEIIRSRILSKLLVCAYDIMGDQVPRISGLPSLKPMVHEGLLEPTGNDNANGMLLGQSPLADLFLLSKTRTHLATSTESYCEKPLSSILATSRGNTSNLLEEILPANCSTLNSHKPQLSLSLKQSKDRFLKERNLRSSDPERKDPPSQNSEVIDLTSNFRCDGQPSTRELIDLTSNCHWDGQPSRAELIVPCSSKKPKLSSIDPEISCYSSFSEISEKHGKRPQLSSYRSTEPGIGDGTRNIQHPKVASVILLEDDMATTKTEFKRKGVTSNPISCDDETKGSAFLIQVQEKLTIAEYKEFVGYMKALKSKTLKISYVLQSIAKLFSTPERLLLLMRFKDFVPAKYRPMYEQLLGTHGAIFDE